jgi:hypothetical protein
MVPQGSFRLVEKTEDADDVNRWAWVFLQFTQF